MAVDYKEIMVFFLEPEARDILYMLADYIDGLEDRLDAYGDNAIAQDKGLQEEQANLAVAIRLHDKIDAVFNETETGTRRCERCGDSPIVGFDCTNIPAELHTEKFTASSAVLCRVCSGVKEVKA